jgi:hypothetical protein
MRAAPLAAAFAPSKERSGKFREHSGNFREHSENIQGTSREIENSVSSATSPGSNIREGKGTLWGSILL